ncbi:hypothetical protein KQI52_08735 [bacterium]|nr:hypothetical protein [bacterium]
MHISLNEKVISSKKEGMWITQFEVVDVDLNDTDKLNEIFQKHVHSMNVWKPGTGCSKDNYIGMFGLALDSDDGLVTIEQALEQFKDYNHIIYTSTNHMEDKPDHGGVQPRFRVILPFSPSEDYYFTDPADAERVYDWAKDTFQGYDPAVFELSRKLFPNTNSDPDKFVLKVNTDADWYAVPMDSVNWFHQVKQMNSGGTGTSDKHGGSREKADTKYLGHDMRFVLPDKRTSYRLDALRPFLKTCKDQKQPCYCPFCDDINSENASAFAQLTKQGFVEMHCSHCKSVGDQHYFYEDPVEPGMFVLEDKMMRVQVKSNNAYVTRMNEDYIRERHRKPTRVYLSRCRNIPASFFTVERLASAAHDKVDFDLDIEEGVLRIQVPSAVKTKKKENDYVDAWLEGLFGQHSDFIKDWLALYCYTNYQKLPVIVLTGPRAAGKTTFAEIVAEIFPDLSIDWTGDQSTFTPAFTKKLLMVEENYINKKSQYTELKKVTGSDYLTVNEKYTPQYRVRNNTNIIMTTNESRPMFLKHDEKPDDPNHNNFFIWEVPGITKVNPRIKQEILDRLGHYIQTELLSRYKKWEAQKDHSTARYGIPCPITDLANDLYDTAHTNIEADAEILAEALVKGEYDDYGNLHGGGSHIKKTALWKLADVLGLRKDRHQQYFQILQDQGVLSRREDRSSTGRFGYKILRSKDYYGDQLSLQCDGMTNCDAF